MRIIKRWEKPRKDMGEDKEKASENMQEDAKTGEKSLLLK